MDLYFFGLWIWNVGAWNSAKIALATEFKGFCWKFRPLKHIFGLWKMAIPYATNPYPHEVPAEKRADGHLVREPVFGVLFAPGCALLRSSTDWRLHSFALICTFLCAFACFFVRAPLQRLRTFINPVWAPICCGLVCTFFPADKGMNSQKKEEFINRFAGNMWTNP